jgi:hypothetical protein
MMDELTLYAFKIYFSHNMYRIRHLVVSCSIFNGPLLRKARTAATLIPTPVSRNLHCLLTTNFY